MKIKELIKRLQEYNENAELFVVDREQNFSFDIVDLNYSFDDKKDYVDIVVDMDI